MGICMHYKYIRPREIKNRRAKAKRTSQNMKSGQDVIICRLESNICHDLLKIVGNSVSNVQIAFISSDLLRSSLFGITCFWLIPVFDFGL